MQKFISVEKMKIIEAATKRQLLEFEELRKNGFLDESELAHFKKIIIEVFEIQKINICA